jgi:hypothetical protein
MQSYKSGAGQKGFTTLVLICAPFFELRERERGALAVLVEESNPEQEQDKPRCI